MEDTLLASIELVQEFLEEYVDEKDVAMGEAHAMVDKELGFVLGEDVIEVGVVHLGDVDQILEEFDYFQLFEVK